MKFDNAIETERLTVRPFLPQNITPEYVSWLNDKQTMRHSEQRHTTHTIESCRDYFQSMQNDCHWFLAISIKQPKLRHIGNISVAFDIENQTADMSIIIGDKSALKNGYGLEAWSGVLEHLLTLKSVRKVTAGTMAVNKAMIGVALRSGMTQESVSCDQFLLDGSPVDLFRFARFANPN